MKGHSHAILGVAALASVHALVAPLSDRPSDLVYFGIVAAVAALVPDIDSDESTIRQATGTARSDGLLGRAASWIMARVTGHRGALTHSLMAWFLFSLLAGMYFVGGMAFVAFSVGYLSHLLADALTPQGVPLLWPLWQRRISVLGPLAIRTGSMAEYAFTAGVAALVAGLFRP